MISVYVLGTVPTLPHFPRNPFQSFPLLSRWVVVIQQLPKRFVGRSTSEPLLRVASGALGLYTVHHGKVYGTTCAIGLITMPERS
jgi:hypothetical protein